MTRRELIRKSGRAPGGPAGRWDRIRAPKFARILIPATENVPGSARIGAKIHGSQRGSERANSPKTPSKHHAKTPWMMGLVLFNYDYDYDHNMSSIGTACTVTGAVIEAVLIGAVLRSAVIGDP